MPAMLDDPAAATIYRVSGDAPYPDPAHPSLPPTILPRRVTLRDRQTVATVVPFASRHQVPESLLRYLNDQFNKEIEGGDTYPMMDPMPFNKFASYWFQNFAGIMLLGSIETADDVEDGKDWSKECLGTFYIKPNYPGRSSHVCNAGFIVTDASRNRGVGRLMGETYLEWAPKLGYTYSVFNLVYETNVASCKIWDALGFKRIGRVKGAGNLKSYPDRLVDAIIYGRDLGEAAGGAGSEELVSEERFDKIKFYLKYGRYPNGADRAEKSRLRSAATHYKLLDGDILMLKDKEVISDPQRQYDIARTVHNQAHAGINKTTATIAERYHWSRIKETVSDVIRNCLECKELGKASSSSQTQAQQPSPSPAGSSAAAVANVAGVKRPSMNSFYGASSGSKRSSPSPSASASSAAAMDLSPVAGGQLPRPLLPPPVSSLPDSSHLAQFNISSHHPQYTDPSAISLVPPPSHRHNTLQAAVDTAMTGIVGDEAHDPLLAQSSHGTGRGTGHGTRPSPHHHQQQPQQLAAVAAHSRSMTLPSLTTAVYQPIDPQIISQSPAGDALHHHHGHDGHNYHPFDDHVSPQHQHHHHHAHDPDADTFQALLNAADDDDDDDDDGDEDHSHNDHGHGHHRNAHEPREDETTHHREDEDEQAAVDRDLEMLIEPQDDDDDEDDDIHHGHPPGRGDAGDASSGAMDVDDIPGLPPPPPPPPPGDGNEKPAAFSPININTHINTNTLSSGSNPDASGNVVSNSSSGGSGGKMDVSRLLSTDVEKEEAASGKDDSGVSGSGHEKARTIYGDEPFVVDGQS